MCNMYKYIYTYFTTLFYKRRKILKISVEIPAAGISQDFLLQVDKHVKFLIQYDPENSRPPWGRKQSLVSPLIPLQPWTLSCTYSPVLSGQKWCKAEGFACFHLSAILKPKKINLQILLWLFYTFYSWFPLVYLHHQLFRQTTFIPFKLSRL